MVTGTAMILAMVTVTVTVMVVATITVTIAVVVTVMVTIKVSWFHVFSQIIILMCLAWHRQLTHVCVLAHFFFFFDDLPGVVLPLPEHL